MSYGSTQQEQKERTKRHGRLRKAVSFQILRPHEKTFRIQNDRFFVSLLYRRLEEAVSRAQPCS